MPFEFIRLFFHPLPSRLSGYDPDDEEDEFDELKELQNKENLSAFDRAKLGIEKIVERVGFLGIMACASVRGSFFRN